MIFVDQFSVLLVHKVSVFLSQHILFEDVKFFKMLVLVVIQILTYVRLLIMVMVMVISMFSMAMTGIVAMAMCFFLITGSIVIFMIMQFIGLLIFWR